MRCALDIAARTEIRSYPRKCFSRVFLGNRDSFLTLTVSFLCYLLLPLPYPSFAAGSEARFTRLFESLTLANVRSHIHIHLVGNDAEYHLCRVSSTTMVLAAGVCSADRPTTTARWFEDTLTVEVPYQRS